MMATLDVVPSRPDIEALLIEYMDAARDVEARAAGLRESEERRYAIVARLYQSGLTIREMAEELGMSAARVHQLVQKARHAGIDTGVK